MKILGINTAGLYTAFRKMGVNQDVFSNENHSRNNFLHKEASKSDDKISKLIDKVNSDEYDETATKVRPQFLPNSPVSKSPKSEKTFSEKLAAFLENPIEEAEILSLEDNYQLYDVEEISEDPYQPRGHYLTIPKEHLVSQPSAYTISEGEKLRRKFEYNGTLRVGGLINLSM